MQKTQANKITTLLLKENWTDNVLILNINVLFYSVLCNRIRYNCCCFWLIIQIMYSPANRVFSFSMQRRWFHPDHVHTMYNIQHFLHAMYFRCYYNCRIEENDNYKVMLYFLSPNIYFYFLFFYSLMKCFIFPQKFCYVYLVIKWRHIFHNFSSSSTFCWTNISFFRTFILMGCCKYLYISMCIWYEDSFT